MRGDRRWLRSLRVGEPGSTVSAWRTPYPGWLLFSIEALRRDGVQTCSVYLDVSRARELRDELSRWIENSL